MKDFDFDELDRAVNSVLTQAKTTSDKPVVSPVTITDNRGAQTISVNVTPASDQTAIQSTADDQVPPAVSADDSSVAVSKPATADDSVGEASVNVEPEVNDQPEVAGQVDTAEQTESDQIEERVLSINVPERTADDQATPSDESMSNPETTQNEEPQSSADNEQVDSQVDQLESIMEEAAPEEAASDQTSPDTTPQKRGKFMDVVRPSTAVPVKPRAVQPRGGVTLQPSSDFTLNAPMIDVAKALEADTPETVVVADSPAETKPAETESETPQISTNHQTTASMNDEQPANDNSTMFPQPELEPEIEPEHKAMSHTPLDFGKTTEAKSELAPGAPTPFIPDVAVDKRPLNPQSLDEAEDASETSSPTPVATVQTNLPKEFNKEILDIDSKETATPSAQPSSAKPMVFSPEPATSKTDNTPQPLFDTASVHQPLIDAKSSASHKTMWLLIFIALFVVGAALGMLYFLYGQQ